MNKLLQLLEDSNDLDESEICLISHEKKNDTYLKLECGHGFNFTHLFEEIKNQKNYSKYNNYILKTNQIKCPYCRNIQNSILPRREGYPLIYGINSPMKYIMYTNKCSHIFKKGVKKGQICNSGCEGLYCIKHQKINVIENTCKYVFKRGVKKGELCNNICSSIYCKSHIKYEKKIDIDIL